MTFGITGGPGSGKGTQCDRICVRYGYTHMSSGDLLRNEVMSMSERGRKLYQLMSKGENVPNSEVDQLLVEAMVSSASKSKVNCNSWNIYENRFSFKRQLCHHCTAMLVWCFSFLCNILFLFVPSLWKPLKIACDLVVVKNSGLLQSLYIYHSVWKSLNNASEASYVYLQINIFEFSRQKS